MSEPTQVPGSAIDPKVIKRYTNRKLYDTVESRYVTLEEIAEMVKSGTEVKIVDNRTKEDLTSVTLAQIIFEEEKKTSRMPLNMLRDIIRTGGNSVQEFLQKEVTSRMQTIREEAESLRSRLFKREGEAEGEVVGPEAPAASRPPDLRVAEPKQKSGTKELVTATTKAFEDWQRKLDERIKAVVEKMTSLPALAKDLTELERVISELEKRVQEQEKR
jgi:polyhydroxyalkanoate synthesis repressor PhaR